MGQSEVARHAHDAAGGGWANNPQLKAAHAAQTQSEWSAQHRGSQQAMLAFERATKCMPKAAALRYLASSIQRQLNHGMQA